MRVVGKPEVIQLDERSVVSRLKCPQRTLPGNGLRGSVGVAVRPATHFPQRLPGPVVDSEPQHHIRKHYAVREDLFDSATSQRRA